MSHLIQQIFQFLREHDALLATLIPFLFAFFKSTRWGQHNQTALVRMAEVIESFGDKAVKAQIQEAIAKEESGVQDALEHAVNVADPGKTPRPAFERAVQELTRGILPKGSK